MKQTYDEAMTRVFADEGGYSNLAADPGGATNWGITIHDARAYWKADATATDVRQMPKSVASQIYRTHYATPISYDTLPAGVDYAVLDYAINSGTSRALRVLQSVSKVNKTPENIINAIYDERVAFLRGLRTFSTFGKGWMSRCSRGRALALALSKKYNSTKSTAAHTTAGVIVAGGAAAATQAPHEYIYWIAGGVVFIALATWILINWYKNRTQKVNNVIVHQDNLAVVGS